MDCLPLYRKNKDNVNGILYCIWSAKYCYYYCHYCAAAANTATANANANANATANATKRRYNSRRRQNNKLH